MNLYCSLKRSLPVLPDAYAFLFMLCNIPMVTAGFKKRGRDEPYTGHYYHTSFQRDHPELLDMVRRTYPSGVKSGDGDYSSPDEENGDPSASHHNRHHHPQNAHPNHPQKQLPRRGGSPTRSLKRKAPSVTAGEGGLAEGKGGGGAGGRSQLEPQHVVAVHQKEKQHDEEGKRQREQQRRSRCAKKPSRDVVREFAWGVDSKRCSLAIDQSVYDNLIRNKPQRPWFYSGSSAVTDAVVRRERAASACRNKFETSQKGKVSLFPSGAAVAASSPPGGTGGSGDRCSRNDCRVGRGYNCVRAQQNEWGRTGRQESLTDRRRSVSEGSCGGRAGVGDLSRYDSPCSTWEKIPRVADALDHRSKTTVASAVAVYSVMNETCRDGRNRFNHAPSPRREGDRCQYPTDAQSLPSERGIQSRQHGQRVPPSSVLPADIYAHQYQHQRSRVLSFPPGSSSGCPPPPVFLPAHVKEEINADMEGGGAGRWGSSWDGDVRDNPGREWSRSSRLPGSRAALEWGVAIAAEEHDAGGVAVVATKKDVVAATAVATARNAAMTASSTYASPVPLPPAPRERCSSGGGVLYKARSCDVLGESDEVLEDERSRELGGFGFLTATAAKASVIEGGGVVGGRRAHRHAMKAM